MSYVMFTKKKYATDPNYRNQAIELTKKNIMNEKGKITIHQFGRLLEGQAYYHETGEYYNCIGFEVEVEREYDFSDKSFRHTGFYSIWKAKTSDTAPFTFEESYRDFGTAHRFDNGLGDHISITKEHKQGA